MKFDTYTLKGRIAPAFFSIILPIMVFNHFFISEEFSKVVGEILGAKLISNLTISVICLYFLSEFGRLIGKNVFERIYFKDESRMPTTNFMMFSDKTYSDDYKMKIREKIKSDFDIMLPKKEEEKTDEILARTRIVETMALIRKKLKGNKFLFQHNVEYGIMRNAIGGAVLGILFSLLNIIFFNFVTKVEMAVFVSIGLFIIYSLLLIFSKIVINFYGRNHAKILFREYMG